MLVVTLAQRLHIICRVGLTSATKQNTLLLEIKLRNNSLLYLSFGLQVFFRSSYKHFTATLFLQTMSAEFVAQVCEEGALFTLFDIVENFDNANEFCQIELLGTLARISSIAEHNVVQKLVEDNDFEIGFWVGKKLLRLTC